MSSFTKVAGVSMTRLRSLLKGEAPLFHLTSKKNSEGLLRLGKAVSPIEARSLGLLHDVEASRYTGVNMRGGVTPPVAPKLTSSLIPNNNLKPTEGSNLVEGYARLLDPRTSGMARASALQRSPHGQGLGKNPATISLSEAPHQEYGDVGLMVTRRGIRGQLHEGRHNSLKEHWVLPTHSRVGNSTELPSVSGTFVYDPRKVERATATELKSRGGIALGGRLHRRLKWLQKHEPPRVHHDPGVSGYGLQKVPDRRLRSVAKRNPDLVAGEASYRRRTLKEIKREGGAPNTWMERWPEHAEFFGGK
jgi:hypothetical protein